MFDVFYTGPKPGQWVFEKPAKDLAEALTLSRTEYCWYIYGASDFAEFDFDYVPVPWQSDFIHVWANQWQPDGQVYLAKRTNNGQYHFHTEVVHRLPVTEYYHIPDHIDADSIDWRWCPDPCDPPLIYHFPDQHQSASGVTYTVPGAANVKLIDAFVVKALANHANWHIPAYIDADSVDLSWHPHELDPPYIYHFPDQHQSASGVTYTVPGAREVKIVDAFVCRAVPDPDKFDIKIPVADFDFSWHPNVLDPAYDYVFGNQWNPATLESTVVYRVPGAMECKYMEEIAQVSADPDRWEVLDDVAQFDYSWRPNPTAPPYVYVFGNQWLTPEQRPALRYVIPGATEIHYVDEPKAWRTSKPELFVTHSDCEFDYSWEPDPGSPAYNYVFGNQWWPAEIMPTVEYHQAGATEQKFLDEPRAKLVAKSDHWVRPGTVDFEFDCSWCPDPGDPPYIYVFGNQWYAAEIMPTVEYHVPGGTERKFVDYHKAKLIPMMDRWNIPEEVDATNIDFSWHPHPAEEPYIHHFGSEHQMSVGLTYTMPGATELKFAGEIPRVIAEQRAITALDIFFVDRNNPAAQPRYDKLKLSYPAIQKIRFANSIMDTIQRCVKRAKTHKFWVISSEYDYVDFDFTWHAEPWQSYMTHVFPSQHQKWSDTFLINRWEFERHAVWAQGLEQFPNLNFVSNQTVSRPENLSNIYYVDHGNAESREQYERLLSRESDVIMTRFVDNYLDTFKRIMATADTEYVWICNSICDYTDFDFTWQPEPWQSEMIHCFASDGQKRGDTFYVHVESFRAQMVDLELLDWFNVINYCEDQVVSRWPMPTVCYESDDLITAIRSHQFTTPYVWFTNQPDVYALENICLWSRKDRVVQRVTRSGASAFIPRDIKSDLRTQIYDYAYLDRGLDGFALTERPLDIIYISNGEPDEHRWYDHLVNVVGNNHGYAWDNRVKWVRGVNGRTAAYQAAARLSDTPWFFAVFAKLEVSADFDWTWQPDYWQGPKHYIFNAKNPINGLEYGHQGMISYCRSLVLANNTPGIDFTLSQAHESVPILSGMAHFNQDAWMTWRTAFREVVKLLHFQSFQPTVETGHRLKVWQTQASGDFAAECLQGAADAQAFYDSVGGDLEQLKQSFDWAWLRTYYDSK